jgi:hypothetical protein
VWQSEKTNPNLKTDMTKYLVSLCLLLALLPTAYAQMGFNSPAGITPRQDAEIYTRNGFLVQQKFQLPADDPNNFTALIDCSNFGGSLTALAGVLKDPGGDNNYPANITYNCSQTITAPVSPTINVIGYEIIVRFSYTESNGDYVRVFNNQGDELITITNAVGGIRQFITGSNVRIQFTTNGNNVVDSGFEIQWRALLSVPPPLILRNLAAGNALQFNTSTGWLTVGLNNDVNTGGSAALGRNNWIRSGEAIALGVGNRLTGAVLGAVTIGKSNSVASSGGIAIGLSNQTTGGFYAMAIGGNNQSSGAYSMAMGSLNVASGNNSTAMGSWMNTGGQTGTFMIGDSDPLGHGYTTALTADRFVARFRNGYFLMTSGNATPMGVQLGAGGTSWGTISDSTRKERFLPIDGPDLLHKISNMKLTTWNYKGQREIRHYGPMAQEFFALFGHDELGPIGCDTLITTQDMEGLTLSAVQALVKENETLKTELQRSQAETQQLRAETQNFASLQAEMNVRLRLLEQALLGRKRVAGRRR